MIAYGFLSILAKLRSEFDGIVQGRPRSRVLMGSWSSCISRMVHSLHDTFLLFPALLLKLNSHSLLSPVSETEFAGELRNSVLLLYEQWLSRW